MTQDYFTSNEELLAKLQAGGTGYDVIVPSDYMVAIMIKSDIIQPLDMSKIPNFKNIGENFKGLPYDPNNEYSVPTSGGPRASSTTRKRSGKAESWDPMWNPEFEGKIGMLNDVRETMGAALYNASATPLTRPATPTSWTRPRRLLKEQKPLLRGYFDSDSGEPALVQNGDLLLGHVFSGDAFLDLRERRTSTTSSPSRRRPAGRTTWRYRWVRSTRTTPTSS